MKRLIEEREDTKGKADLHHWGHRLLWPDQDRENWEEGLSEADAGRLKNDWLNAPSD